MPAVLARGRRQIDGEPTLRAGIIAVEMLQKLLLILLGTSVHPPPSFRHDDRIGWPYIWVGTHARYPPRVFWGREASREWVSASITIRRKSRPFRFAVSWTLFNRA